MTAAEFKNKFNEMDEPDKIIIRDRCIKEIPISYASFYRKTELCSWNNAELLMIKNLIN